MTRIALIGVAGALLLGGATFAMAQNGPPTGGYHHHYGYHHHHHGY